MIGMSQQKKVMMKQRVTSSVSILFTSPYLTMRIIPRAAIPTKTIDQPTMSHLKKSDKRTPILNDQCSIGNNRPISQPSAILNHLMDPTRFSDDPRAPHDRSLIIGRCPFTILHSPRALRLYFLISA